MSADVVVQGDGGLLEDPARVGQDIRLLRRLLKHPSYVPNECFREQARKLWQIAKSSKHEVRARVHAHKAIIDIMKLNLAANESTKEDKAEQHLHLHGQAVPHSKIFYDLPPVEALTHEGDRLP